jgi:hypothetical protein
MSTVLAEIITALVPVEIGEIRNSNVKGSCFLHNCAHRVEKPCQSRIRQRYSCCDSQHAWLCRAPGGPDTSQLVSVHLCRCVWSVLWFTTTILLSKTTTYSRNRRTIWKENPETRFSCRHYPRHCFFLKKTKQTKSIRAVHCSAPSLSFVFILK